MPLEDLSFSLSEDEEEKVSAEIKVVSESNISVNFDLSNDSVISEAVRCIKCSNQVGDLQKAQVVCHSCHYHTPTQTKEVLNVF
jgi:acetyl-CoA carboxylase beta subunit